MIQKASAMTVRQNLSELLNKIFEKIRYMKYQFACLSGELANSYKNVKRDIAEKEIAEAVLNVRNKNK